MGLVNTNPFWSRDRSLHSYEGLRGSVGLFLLLETNFPSSFISFTLNLETASTVLNSFEGSLPSTVSFFGLLIDLGADFFCGRSEISKVFLKNLGGGATSTYVICNSTGWDEGNLYFGTSGLVGFYSLFDLNSTACGWANSMSSVRSGLDVLLMRIQLSGLG